MNDADLVKGPRVRQIVRRALERLDRRRPLQGRQERGVDMRALLISVCVAAAAIGCSQKQESVQAAAPPAAAPKLGIRPDGDTEIKIDASKVTSEELKKVYSYIDEHI